MYSVSAIQQALSLYLEDRDASIFQLKAKSRELIISFDQNVSGVYRYLFQTVREFLECPDESIDMDKLAVEVEVLRYAIDKKMASIDSEVGSFSDQITYKIEAFLDRNLIDDDCGKKSHIMIQISSLFSALNGIRHEDIKLDHDVTSQCSPWDAYAGYSAEEVKGLMCETIDSIE